MYKSIKDNIKRDTDYPLRQHNINVLTRVIKGTLYDEMKYDFHQEKTEGVVGEYIPLRDRRPSVRYALCRVVVDDSISLLFSEGHFPTVDCKDEGTRKALADIIKESNLNQVMIDAATTGSVGSVVILMRVLKGRLFFSVFNTQFMTPVWFADAPDTLEKVVEKYKVDGKVLVDQGYANIDDKATYWFMREWDITAETWFLPWKASEEPVRTVDASKTTKHNLGFVPMVWVKNLPGGDDIDGECTFPTEAIDTQIEIDYQLSQAGRGLKYSSDPTLLLKEPAMGESGSVVKGGGNAIVVGADGDAKMLEIDGSAAKAVIEYVRALRELALESAHGNRANADKISAAQSGRAMELMNQSLIWLADKLRISYGEGALLSLLRMIQKASSTTSLKLMVKGKEVDAIKPDEPIALKWPAWYAPTYTDIQAMATALNLLVQTNILSREAAIKKIADYFDIEDIAAEKALIDADMKMKTDMDAKAAAAAKPVPETDATGAE